MIFTCFFLVLAAPIAICFKFGCTVPYSCQPIKTCGQGHRDGYLENQVLFQCGHGYLCCPPSKNDAFAGPWIDEPTKEGYNAIPTELDPPKHRNQHLIPENCGMTLNNKIINGEDSEIGEFPWMALIGFKDLEGKVVYVCGGTLISDRYVLTAAHCLTREDSVLSQVRLGEFDLTTEKDCKGAECFKPSVDVPVVKIIQHEDWNNQTYRNDIALLRLNSSTLALGQSTISPICLPFNTSAVRLNLTEGYRYETAGWGITNWMGNTLSNVLKKTQLGAISVENCNNVICPRTRLKQSFCPIETTQICVQGVRKRDVCKGDSGGPLMTSNTLPTYQFGITSFKTTEVCGEELVPSVFTRIEPYLTWILDNLEP